MAKEEMIDQIADIFRRHGYDGATLSRISERTGLGRASLYHHFPNGKEDMAREVFRRVLEALDRDIIQALRGTGTPRERLKQWARGTERFFAQGNKNCLLAAMIVSGSRDRFSEELRTSFQIWIDSLAEVLQEAGIGRREARNRAEDAIGRIEGALIVSRGLQNNSPFKRVLRDLPNVLLEGTG